MLEGREDADDQVEGAARAVPDEVGGDGRRLVRRADHAEDARDGDVADVVPGPLGQRAVLTPAGHPAVDQRRVAGQAGVGADTEPLGDAGAQPLDEDVGALGEVEHDLRAPRGLEVDGHRALVAVGDVVGRVDAQTGAGRAIDAHHVGAEVGEHHRRVRAGADACQFHDPHPGERTVWCCRHPTPTSL